MLYLTVSADGQYVDLVENPERFTGYAGPSSSRVWRAIYEENCFAPVPYVDPSRPQSEGGSGYASLSSAFAFSPPGMEDDSMSAGLWTAPESQLMGSLAGPRDTGDETCLEKRVFYRLISGEPDSLFSRAALQADHALYSGLHASISIHICDEYFDQSTGEWVRCCLAAIQHFVR